MPTPTQFSDAKRRLLERFLRGEVARQNYELPIPVRAPGESTPLALVQQQVWLHSQMAPELPLYNEPVIVHYRGDLDRRALERAFQEVLRRHEIWRSAFPSVDGQIVQAIYNGYSIDIPYLDLTHVSPERRDPEMLRIASADVQRPFDLAVGPLIRPKLFRMAEQEHRLHLALHHIVFDGVSLHKVFLPKLARFMRPFQKGCPLRSRNPNINTATSPFGRSVSSITIPPPGSWNSGGDSSRGRYPVLSFPPTGRARPRFRIAEAK